MIIDWIYNKLIQKRDEERHKVIKLEWKKAELKKRLIMVKNINNDYNNN